MAISFNGIPTNNRVPAFLVEFDNTRAVKGADIISYRGLVVGHKTSTGTQPLLTPVRVTSAAQASKLFGPGSILHLMADKWFKNNTTTEVDFVAVDEPAGAKAAGGFQFGGTPTAAGTLSLYIAGQAIQLAVAQGASAASLATALAAAIQANTSLPVTAAVDGVDTTLVVITAKHVGTLGNGIDIRVNYFDGEATPAGMTGTITAMTGGTGAPTVSTLWAALGDEWYNIFAWPFNDASSLTALEAELASRFGPLRMIDGVAFVGSTAAYNTVSALGDSRNSPHVSIMGLPATPNTSWELAGCVAAIAALYGNIDPARPFQTLPMNGILAPVKTARLTAQERNLLLYDGISQSHTAAGGVQVVDRLITTYKQNALGADDVSYLDVTTMLTLMYLRYSLRNYFLRKYPRHKLANDGTRYGEGQAIITPKLAKSECIALFAEWENLGLVENREQFKAELVVERNAQDQNRLDFLLPPDLVNQFITGAAQIQFIL